MSKDTISDSPERPLVTGGWAGRHIELAAVAQRLAFSSATALVDQFRSFKRDETIKAGAGQGSEISRVLGDAGEDCLQAYWGRLKPQPFGTRVGTSVPAPGPYLCPLA
jgi:hypothetical protein